LWEAIFFLYCCLLLLLLWWWVVVEGLFSCVRMCLLPVVGGGCGRVFGVGYS